MSYGLEELIERCKKVATTQSATSLLHTEIKDVESIALLIKTTLTEKSIIPTGLVLTKLNEWVSEANAALNTIEKC